MRIPLLFFAILCSADISHAQDLDSLCLPQSSGHFWSVKLATGDIHEYTLSGGSVQVGAMILGGPEGLFNLAFCSAAGPVSFYGNGGGSFITYYENGMWMEVPTGDTPYNFGGAGEHLYFIALASDGDLYHFSGTTSANIVDPSPGIFPGDVVATADGNALVPYADGPTTQMVSEYRMYSPTGALLNTYSVSYPWNGNYGSFMLGDVVYLAFGPTNPIYPDALVPMTFSGDVATLGAPIEFFRDDNVDLASCLESPVGLPELAINWGRLATYPNPAGDHLIVLLPVELQRRPLELQMTDVRGTIVAVPYARHEDGLRIDTDALAAGLYQLMLTDIDGRRYCTRIVVVPA